MVKAYNLIPLSLSLPRDGSAVELVGLSYSAIVWLHQLYQLGQFPYSQVNLPSDDPHCT